MTILYSSEFEKKLKKIKRSDPNKLKTIIRKIQFFSQNPQYPSLKLHKLGGVLKEYYSFSVSPNLRIIFSWKDLDTVLFYTIGTHDEVYKQN